MAWVSNLRPITTPCPYRALTYQIQNQVSKLTPQRFDEEIARIPNFNPLVIPPRTDDEMEARPSILVAALSNRLYELARHITLKFPCLLGLLFGSEEFSGFDEFSLPLSNLAVDIFERYAENAYNPKAISFLLWSFTSFPEYRNVMSHSSSKTLLFGLLEVLQLEIFDAKTKAMKEKFRIAFQTCVSLVNNGAVIYPPILKVAERENWPRFLKTAKEMLQVKFPHVLIGIILDYSQNFWSILMPFPDPNTLDPQHLSLSHASFSTLRKKCLRKFLTQVIEAVWLPKDESRQKRKIITRSHSKRRRKKMENY